MRKQIGQMLIDFCERNGLVIIKTWFEKPKRKLYIWKSPGDMRQHQLDYVLVKKRFGSSVKDVPEADIDSYHNLLVAEICTRLKQIISFQTLEKLYAQRQKVHDSLEENLMQTNVKVGMWKCSGTISRNVYWIL
jgi:hypothetical protein